MTGLRPGAQLLSKTRKENKMPEGKQIRISNRLYEHLKSMGGVMSKNLDELVFGKPDNNPLSQDKLDDMLEQATIPDSVMLYSAILLSWGDKNKVYENIEDWNKSITRSTIVANVKDYFEELADIEIRKTLMPTFFHDMDNYRSKFQTTIDNRLTNLVRAGVLERKDGKYLITQKPNLGFISNCWDYYASSIASLTIKTRKFIEMIFSEDDGSNDSFPI